MRLGSTMLAMDFISSLPKEMGGMSTVFLLKRSVDTWALHIGGESLLIGPLVYALATGCASEIPFGFFKGVGTGWLLLDLFLKQTGNHLSPGGFAVYWLVRAVQVGVGLIKLDLRTGLVEAFFNGGGRECLVDSGATGTTLVAASVGLPAVIRCLPCFGA